LHLCTIVQLATVNVHGLYPQNIMNLDGEVSTVADRAARIRIPAG